MAKTVIVFGIFSLLVGLTLSLGSSVNVHHHGNVASKRSSTGSRSMSYFISRGIEIKKRERSLYDRVKRAVTGEENSQPVIESLFVSSNITSRFSNAVIESVIYNPFDDDKEATFRVKLPEEAFMSNFTMYIDGELYVAEVKSKEQAEKEYEEAQDQNKTAGMVSNEDWTPEEEVRGMENFKVSVNIAAKSNISFTLSYMELLKKRGQYTQKISVRPNQIVNDLEVIVLIFESQGITNVEVIEPDSNSVNPLHTRIVHMKNAEVAEISYHPTAEQQKQVKKKDNKGVKGELIVSYDVVHSDSVGLVQVEGDYFIHYFSPPSENYIPLPKNVVFVIDISGSMSGDKIEQTRQAMLKILDQLREDDKFVILLFDDVQEYWPERSPKLMEASAQNINAAKGYVREKVKADGGTNINDALVSAARFLRSHEQFGADMIVFLTDGDPTVGVTDTETILANVEKATDDRISIFSLGFGFNMNFDLLRAISFRNNGFASRIYADVDARTQLEDFFEDINTPLLYNLEVSYGDFPLSLTQTNFPQFFKNSEIIIAGKFDSGAPEEFDVSLSAMSVRPVNMNERVICDLSLVIPPPAKPVFKPGSLERLYVYMKIKDQLRKVLMTDDEEKKEELEQFALGLALEYHLVTPLTSFIIVQQETPQAAVDERAYFDMGATAYPAGSPSTKYYSTACQSLGSMFLMVLVLTCSLLTSQF